GIRDGHVTGVQTCALPISDYGSAIIIIHTVIPNYHVMGTCMRIYAVMSAVMYPVVLDNHVAHVYRIKSKIQMIKIIVPYYAAMRSEERRVGKDRRYRYAKT